jgi:N-acetylmuramic acid 6-phosphate etherase
MNEELDNLTSESVNPRTAELSRLPTLQALTLINDEDALVAPAVRLVLPEIARAVDGITARLQNGGRLIYIGAGTSGRLGVVDASECPPTFGVSPQLVQALIAGGPSAVFGSQEGAEDSAEGGVEALQEIGLNSKDCVVGLAASGRTPYVLGALEYARQIKALTVGITVNANAKMRSDCDVFIAPVVGPEAVAGSSRMKAGTAQKMVLNMISTGVMVKLGYVDGNRMTHLQTSCDKLVDRARRLVRDLTGADLATAAKALEENENEVWRAVQALREAAASQ